MMGAVEKLLEEHENRVERLNKRVDDPASGMTLGEYEDKLAALRAETAAKIAGSGPCEYCQGGKKIETEIDGEGYLLVYDADTEEHVDGFICPGCEMAFRVSKLETDGPYIVDWQVEFEFAPKFCPNCGKELAGDAE